MTSDLHIHPLEHKYYFAMTEGFSKIVLDDEDKRAIREVVDWCLHIRGLNAIALTDHDMIQASLYAAEYVKEAALPIEIITGAECSVCDPHTDMEYDEIHLLCLGIDKLPKYNSRTPVDKLTKEVHELGGYVIMSHPIQYPQSFSRYCHLLDGYERRNSNKQPFEAEKVYSNLRTLPIQAYNNSDFHYTGKFPAACAEGLQSNYYEGRVLHR